jgi:hypothetical protein
VDAWSDVITEEVRKALGIDNQEKPTSAWEIRSSRLRELVKPLGYFPSYFKETVMDNRYGTILNAIPLREMAERHWSDGSDKLPWHYEDKWAYGMNKWDQNIIEKNESEYLKFRQTLDRIANHAKAIESMKDGVKKRATGKEDFAAVLLYLMSLEAQAQAQTKLKKHETDKPKSTVPHAHG